MSGLAIALAEQGRLEEAASCFLQLLAQRPEDAKVPHNLGLVRFRQGRLKEAAAWFQRALQLRPDLAEAHYHLGRTREFEGSWDDAQACYCQALNLRPDFVEARHDLVQLDNPASHFFRGNFLKEQGLINEAVASFEQSLRIRPDFPEALNNLGLALPNLGRLDEAEACCRQALRLRPGDPIPLNNLGLVLQERANLAEAAVCFQQALRLAPKIPGIHENYAQLLLLQGRFDEGWSEFEWRWLAPDFPPRSFDVPRWDGSSLAGRTILLYTEQGLGDTLQFVRYAPLVQARGGRVVLECEPPLLPLLASFAGIDRLVGEGEELPPFDVQAPLLSLPGILGTRLETIPAPIPYLVADPERVDRWRGELGDGGLKVGIVWQGNPLYKRDWQRSAPLGWFAPLAEVEGVRLYSLQKGPGAEQLAGAGFRIIDLGTRLTDFADTAAVLKNLDLVVTTDTAVPHCAGALGVPVWVALSFLPDWRWLLNREDCPWYPTMRLFRQQEPRNWTDVFQRIVAAMRQTAANGIPHTPREG